MRKTVLLTLFTLVLMLGFGCSQDKTEDKACAVAGAKSCPLETKSACPTDCTKPCCAKTEHTCPLDCTKPCCVKAKEVATDKSS